MSHNSDTMNSDHVCIQIPSKFKVKVAITKLKLLHIYCTCKQTAKSNAQHVYIKLPHLDKTLGVYVIYLCELQYDTA